MDKCVLYAPNVHTGGGLVLLQDLLAAWPKGMPMVAILDERARARLSIPESSVAYWTAPTLLARLAAEFKLWQAALKGGTVLCFHGLPPILPTKAYVHVFLQNRLYIDENLPSAFRPTTRARISLERRIAKLLANHVCQYIVQTPTMERTLQRWLARRVGIARKVVIRPFLDGSRLNMRPHGTDYRWDFIFIADGETHKNHKTLVEAWCLLAVEGIRPSLGLTLGSRDAALWREIDEVRRTCDVRIDNVGVQSREGILELYRNTRALIFPSLTESFGLPLVEARQMKIPILAPEVDYVRDVCAPAETFDPNSAVSIARSVKRFLGLASEHSPIRTPSEFWSDLLTDSK